MTTMTMSPRENSDTAGHLVDLTEPGPLRLDVLAVNAADVVSSAGGWLFNRARAGWTVTVFLTEHHDACALQILGAHTSPLASLPHVAPSGTTPHVLAAASDVIGTDRRARAGVANALRFTGERIVMWGDPLPTDPQCRVKNYQHRLTDAAMAFKAHASRAAGLEVHPVARFEQFRCRIRTVGPCDADLTPIQ